jgi:RNA polymerase sigma-70 factor, ECF subfamily
VVDTIKALREGDHQAYEQLFDTCYDALCRYAYSILRDMDEAEDIVQKSFCKLWDQRESLDIQSSIKSYMYRMVHNESLNKVHQQKNRQEHNLNYISAMNQTPDTVSEHMAASELQLAIDKALEALPTQCRKVFEMSRVQQLSYAEIAKELGISTNTVENHVSKALKLLRVDLKEFLTIVLLLQLLK